MNKERSLQVDFLRGAAIIGVLFIHSSFAWSPRASLLIEIAARLSRPAVVIFFFCSGYCSKTLQSPRIASQLSRCSSLFGSYLIWLFLSVLAARLICSAGFVCPWGSENLLGFRIGYLELSPVAFQLYFLLALIIIKIVDVLVASTGIRGFSLAASHFFIAFAFIALLGFPKAWHGSDLSNLSLYFFSFGLGRVVQIWRNPLPPALQSIALSLSLIGLAFLGNQLNLVGFLFTSGILFCSLGTAEFFHSCFPRVSAALCSLGVISGGIYLLHAPFISSLIYKMVSPLGQAGIFSLISFLLALLFSCVFLVRSLSFLLGNKASRFLLLS